MAEQNDDQVILAAVDKFLQRDVMPYAKQLELADEYPTEIVEKMRTLGLFGATIGTRYGGLGLSAATYALIVERVAAVWMSVSGIFNSHLIMCAAIEKFASETVKEQFLPRLASGELRGGIALTEPDCGTDLQAIRTRAQRVDDQYVISGTKQWITNAVQGNVLAVLVKTDTQVQPRHKGMSLLIVEKSSGYQASKLSKLGYRGIDTAEVHFDEVAVPAENLIGGVEGRGLQQILSGLALGRINVAARGVGVAKAAMQASVSYAQVRQTFGQPIGQHQAIQLKLGEMAAKVEASSLLIAQAARMYDAGERCDYEAGVAKYFASETGMYCANEAMRIFGGYSLSVEYEIERYYRDAMLMCIGEGTNEMQRIIISKQLIARNQS